MSKTTIIQALKDLQQEISNKKKALRPLFEDGLAELFVKHPVVKSLEVRVNNHEFNDGDATHFSLYYDDMAIRFSDGVVIDPYGEDEGEPSAKHKTAQTALVKFFGEFDVEDFYETLYGDAYEMLSFRLKNGKVVTD